MLGALDLGVGRPDAARPGAECRRPQRELVRVVRYSTARCDFADFMCRVRLRMMLFLVHQVINGKTPTFPFPPLSCAAGCRVPCRACTGHALRSSGTGESDESGCQLSRLSSHESGDWSGTGCGTTKVQGQATKHDAACAGTAPRAHHDPTKMYIRAYGSTVRGQCLQVHSMRAGAAPGSRCSPTPFYTQTPVSSLKRCPHDTQAHHSSRSRVERGLGVSRLGPRPRPDRVRRAVLSG